MTRFRLRSLRPRPRRTDFVRIVLLALTLIVANGMSVYAMAPMRHAEAAGDRTASHHCDESPASKVSSQVREHGDTCPCCHHGCLCLHVCGDAIAETAPMRPLAPAAHAPPQNGAVPPMPPPAEQLRPPIA